MQPTAPNSINQTPVATSLPPIHHSQSSSNPTYLAQLIDHQGREGKKENQHVLLTTGMSSSMENQQQAAGSSSSSWRRFNANNSSSSPHSLHDHNKKHKLVDVDSFWSSDDDDDGNVNPEDSDEDMFTVPDVEAMRPDDKPISTSTVTNNNATSKNNPPETAFSGKRRRGRNPVDKEYRRLKRLLRNRVSAQQARERKKVYVNDLESRAKELEDANSNLEEKISTLVNENTMLRKVLMNTRPKVDESIEQKQDRSGK